MRTMLAAWISNYLTKHKNSEVVREFSHRKMLTKKIPNQSLQSVHFCVAGRVRGTRYEVIHISYFAYKLYSGHCGLLSMLIEMTGRSPQVLETNKLELN